MDFETATLANPTISQNNTPIVIDTSSWVLKRDDESRFSKKTDSSAFKPKKLAHVYDKQGNVALRSMVVDLI